MRDEALRPRGGAGRGRVSVVIPTFNRARYLPIAVESALGQVGVDVEVIVVDDGSTDDTPAVVAAKSVAWAERVRYLRQGNAERSAARNRGLALTTGEFVAFLDSDDVWRPEHAARCVSLLRGNPAAAGAYGEYGLIDAIGGEIRPWVPRRVASGPELLRALCLKRIILHPSEVVLRRASLPTEAFDLAAIGGEDWLLWVSLAARADLLAVGQPTVWMRIHEGNTFGDPDRFSSGLMNAAQKVVASGVLRGIGLSPRRVRGINRIHCAYAYYLSDRVASAATLLATALREYPLAVREPDLWRVLLRLAAGPALARWIRRRRQRAPGARPDGGGGA
jgi:glycosyltransferase involved in cell wall biosynthesis